MVRPTITRSISSSCTIRRLQVLGVLLCLIGVAGIVPGYTAGTTDERPTLGSPETVDGPIEGATVLTTQADTTAPGSLLVFTPGGQLDVRSERWRTYFDVDPIGPETIMFTASEKLSGDACPGTISKCYRAAIVHRNLRTGDEEIVHEWWSRQGATGRNHDVDRLGPNCYLVADIQRDSVYVLNTSTGVREWTWRAQSDFEFSSGGEFPKDWTHINDVEQLEDGRIMVSLRNQDTVIMLNDEGDIVDRIGRDDDHDTLYEQHNPDYIPEKEGGPAVLIADSENNRIVEYQKTGSGWKQSWVWADSRLSWPRDADRLPNEHTLITDSHGNRVVEVNESGEVVWEVSAGLPYEAERLGTGDESKNGESAASLGLASRRERREVTTAQSVPARIKGLFPAKIVHALQFATPVWVGMLEFAAGGLAFVGVGLVIGPPCWIRVRRYRLQSPVTGIMPNGREQ